MWLLLVAANPRASLIPRGLLAQAMRRSYIFLGLALMAAGIQKFLCWATEQTRPVRALTKLPRPQQASLAAGVHLMQSFGACSSACTSALFSNTSRIQQKSSCNAIKYLSVCAAERLTFFTGRPAFQLAVLSEGWALSTIDNDADHKPVSLRQAHAASPIRESLKAEFLACTVSSLNYLWPKPLFVIILWLCGLGLLCPNADVTRARSRAEPQSDMRTRNLAFLGCSIHLVG